MRTLFRSPLWLIPFLAAVLVVGVERPALGKDMGLANVREALVVVRVTWSGILTAVRKDGTPISDYKSVSGTCTGWFVSSEGHVVTAGHCVDDQAAREMLIRFFTEKNYGLLDQSRATTVSKVTTTVSVEQPDGAIFPKTAAQILDYQPFGAGDITLLRVPYVNNATALTVASQPPAAGSQVFTIGYPSATLGPEFARTAPTVNRGFVSSQQIYNGVPVTSVTAPIFGGMSGGPALNSQGQVVGINSFELEGLNFIIGTDALQDFLRSHGISGTTPIAAAPTAQHSSTTRVFFYWVGIVAMILLVMAVIVAVALTVRTIVLARRKAVVMHRCSICQKPSLPGPHS